MTPHVHKYCFRIESHATPTCTMRDTDSHRAFVLNDLVHIVRVCLQKERAQTVELLSLLGAIMAVGGSLATRAVRVNTTKLNQVHIL